MKIICPIRPSNFTNFLENLEKINNRADIIEIWLDSIDDIDFFLKNFQKFKEKNKNNLKFLAVCKTKKENGNFEGTPKERCLVLQKFLKFGGNFIDIDITQNSENEIKKFSSKNLILSFHDFEGISSDLENIFEEMKKFKPFVYKFAVTTNNKKDLKKFLEFVKNFPKEKKAIFTTMGKYGQIGRGQIGQKFWGGFFAIDKKSTTASGQMTLEDISKNHHLH